MLGWKRQGCERVTPSPPDLMRQMREALKGRGEWWWLVGSTRCAESCGTECISRLQLHELPTCPEKSTNDESQRLSKKPLISPHKDSPHDLTSVLPFGSMGHSLVRGSVLVAAFLRSKLISAGSAGSEAVLSVLALLPFVLHRHKHRAIDPILPMALTSILFSTCPPPKGGFRHYIDAILGIL